MRLSSSTDVTFWSLVSGKFAAFEGAQDVVGPCLNLTPVRVRIDPDRSFRDLLHQIYNQQIAAIPYELAPFDASTKQSLWPESVRYASIFQYQNLPDQETSEKQSANFSAWTTAGVAVYNGGLLQDGGCWLMAWPQKDECAGFRFRFYEKTMSPSTADSTFELFYKILRAMNDNLDDEVYSTLLLQSEEILEQGNIPRLASEAINFHKPSTQPIPSACSAVIECLLGIWHCIFHPLIWKKEEYPIIGQDESFFDRGGNSISAAEMSSLCTEVGFNLTLQDIIDFPTLRLQTLLISGLIECPTRDPPKLHFSPGQKFTI